MSFHKTLDDDGDADLDDVVDDDDRPVAKIFRSDSFGQYMDLWSKVQHFSHGGKTGSTHG